MSSVPAQRKPSIVHTFGQLVIEFVQAVGDLALFASSMLRWLFRGLPRSTVVVESMYEVGVRSIPVVMITGMFIGMVLAVQGYQQFHLMRMETRMGAVINMALVAELGPVLAATMLAGANPIQYLVVPRFLSCFLLIPLLTAMADAIGVAGGWMFSTQVLGVDSTYYWHYSTEYVAAWDVFAGILKSMFFGAAIALIACHRGFNCGSGAEGVGQAATSSFVLSFIVILIVDFFLGMFLNEIYWTLWPGPSSFV
jgi:phospholipid/cholesterol/gamma-HCH transport system permease protein